MDIWQKNLYALWVMQFLVMMGMNLIFPFIPLYIQEELGVSDIVLVQRWSGAVTAISFLTSAMFAPIWGVVGDRYGRKLMILRAVFGVGTIMSLMGFARNVQQLFALRFLQGCLGGFVPACTALVSTSAPKERMGYALGALQTAMPVGSIAGPILGGLLADLIGYRHIFVVTGFLTFLGGFLVVALVKEEWTPPKKDEKFNLLDNLRFVLTDKQIIGVVISLFVTQVGIMIAQPIFPLFVAQLRVPEKYLATVVGAIFGSAGVTTMLAAPLWGRKADKDGYKRTLNICLLGSGISTAPQAVVNSAYQLLLIRPVMGAFMAGISPAVMSIIAEKTPDTRRGGVLGITSSATLIGGVIGPLSGGFFSPLIGMRMLFILASLFILIGWALALKLIK
jgi:DHA1 family multidrug resistance protein-like MFS transporter